MAPASWAGGVRRPRLGCQPDASEPSTTRIGRIRCEAQLALNELPLDADVCLDVVRAAGAVDELGFERGDEAPEAIRGDARDAMVHLAASRPRFRAVRA